MRIQHNIMAMNAYRNYNNNASALSKNLEKLSSGYKINRAGDDAAGLAISEKMRAQITGLNAAQKNVKDGISLVKTAEGAMQEVQDMLNRMDYLATQSANGTYDDPVDRYNLQKEVNQLKTEINRIADSANFNGIKLLDGSLSTKGNTAGLAEAQDKAAAANAAAAASASAANAANAAAAAAKTISGVDRMPGSDINGQTAWSVAGEKNIYDTTTASGTPASFQIDLNNLGWDVDTTKATAAMGSAKGVTGFTLTIGSGTDASWTVGSAYATNATLQITSKTGGGFELKANDNNVTATNIAKDIVNTMASKTQASQASITLNGVDWTVKASNGVLTFTQKKDPATASQARADFNVKVGFATDATASDGIVTMKNSIQAGTQVLTEGVVKTDGNRANTTFDIQLSDIKDGTVITVGTKSVILKTAGGKAAQGTHTALVDLSDMGSLTDADLNTIVNKIGKEFGTSVKHTLATADGGLGVQAKFSVGVGSDGHSIRVQRVSNSDSTNDPKNIYDTKDKLGKVFSISIPATTKASDVVASTTTVNASDYAGKPLTLQIGDTSDKFNQMDVEIGEMHTNAMGKFTKASDGTESIASGDSIAEVDISTQSGAQAAIDVIKGAINYVSGIRGDLGAIQNRLEHTANNLSVMAENIQDAESTIRDTDVAEEMMSYVKNNILVQSAQAMLAQANQVPQGVLQLLG